MANNYIPKNKSSLIFVAGLLLFFGINLFSAATMGVHFDEAYYWLYSQHPAFGYFDHPPMIAWLIIVGMWLFKGTLGLRITIIILSSCSVLILWLLSKQYGEKPLLFWLLIYSVILIQPYAFIATPDAPLFFFSTLFFYVYRGYLRKQNTQNIILLALTIALMFYSKYHSLLIVVFTVLSNSNELKKKSFWMIILLVIIFMIPHLLWQLENNFPSIRYHIIESHKTAYKPIVTVNYILNLVLLLGPLMGWLLLYVLGSIKFENNFEKTLKWVGIGTIVFFFVATFSGDFEAHWTLISAIPIIILSYKFINKNKKWQRWIIVAGGLNFAILLSMRIIIITPVSNNIKALSTFNGWEENTKQLKQAIGEYPILFQDTWNKAARFAWYANNSNISNLNSALHRRNQFDIWDKDELLAGQTVCVVATDSTFLTEANKVITPKITWYYKIIKNFHSYYNIELNYVDKKQEKGITTITCTIKNPYNETIIFDNKLKASFQLYTKRQNKWVILYDCPINFLNINANSRVQYNAIFETKNDLPPETYLMLKIDNLQPIPSKCLLK